MLEIAPSIILNFAIGRYSSSVSNPSSPQENLGQYTGAVGEIFWAATGDLQPSTRKAVPLAKTARENSTTAPVNHPPTSISIGNRYWGECWRLRRKTGAAGATPLSAAPPYCVLWRPVIRRAHPASSRRNQTHTTGVSALGSSICRSMSWAVDIDPTGGGGGCQGQTARQPGPASGSAGQQAGERITRTLNGATGEKPAQFITGGGEGHPWIRSTGTIS